MFYRVVPCTPTPSGGELPSVRRARCIDEGASRVAPRQGCKCFTIAGVGPCGHLAPLTGCGTRRLLVYTPSTPDGVAGNLFVECPNCSHLGQEVVVCT